MIVEELSPFPHNSNPFNHDAYHMGTHLGNNVCVMYGQFEKDHQPYIIIIDRTTGERKKVTFATA